MEAEERPSKFRRLSQSSTQNNEVNQNSRSSTLSISNAMSPPKDHATSDAIDKEEAEELHNSAAKNHLNSPPPIDPSDVSPSLQPPTAVNGSDPFSAIEVTPSSAVPALSKSRLKKLRKQEEWEAGRDDRKQLRKEKMAEKRARKRSARAEWNVAESCPPSTSSGSSAKTRSKTPRTPHEQLPITFVLDCGFDGLMTEAERISLGGQLTRCYSDNARARWRAHLVLSSLGGGLRERFDGLLQGHYRNWKGVRVFEEEEKMDEDGQQKVKERAWGDFVVAAEKAQEWMKGAAGGKLGGALARGEGETENEERGKEEEGEVVYLSADSDETLTELKPYSTYIIGGLVDRNRHKGICAKRAAERGIRTARLPIGEYMRMSSRFVLATNHVNEIMLRWLESGDWGKAFLDVMPKRKGGQLKDEGEAAQGDCGREEKERHGVEGGGMQGSGGDEAVKESAGGAPKDGEERRNAIENGAVGACADEHGSQRGEGTAVDAVNEKQSQA